MSLWAVRRLSCMPIQNLNPYIHFDGSAARAIRLYERVFGAKVEMTMTFAQHPGSTVPEGHKDRIMHAQLRIGESLVLMVSDAPPEWPIPEGSNIDIALEFTDIESLERTFAELSEGGQVTVAPHDAFWGARFGMLKDEFGVDWMFSCMAKPA